MIRKAIAYATLGFIAAGLLYLMLRFLFGGG